MMAVDNASGEVLAMVGGRDFALSQFNRATQAQRQVGSSFKPYVYTTAVEAGAKPTDIIVDGPMTFPTPNGPYTPHNYEGDYKGAMTLLNAFAESRNIPALKLAEQCGHSQGDRDGASVWGHEQYSGVSAGGDRGGGHYAVRAGGGVQRVSE